MQGTYDGKPVPVAVNADGQLSCAIAPVYAVGPDGLQPLTCDANGHLYCAQAQERETQQVTQFANLAKRLDQSAAALRHLSEMFEQKMSRSAHVSCVALSADGVPKVVVDAPNAKIYAIRLKSHTSFRTLVKIRWRSTKNDAAAEAFETLRAAGTPHEMPEKYIDRAALDELNFDHKIDRFLFGAESYDLVLANPLQAVCCLEISCHLQKSELGSAEPPQNAVGATVEFTTA
jgi:hypothetical protein